MIFVEMKQRFWTWGFVNGIVERFYLNWSLTLKTKSCINIIIIQYQKKINRTWSSVSNSSLCKTFALGSLQNLKFRTSVSSLQRSFSLKFILGKTNFLGLKKFSFPEKYLAKKKPCVWKNSRSQKVSGRKKILGPKKILGLKKNSRSEKNFGSKKNFSSEKNFGSEKNSGSKKKIWVKRKIMLWKIFWVREKILGLKLFWSSYCRFWWFSSDLRWVHTYSSLLYSLNWTHSRFTIFVSVTLASEDVIAEFAH